MTLNVAIIGGGMGGLTAAIALRQHPAINVNVYEQATAIQTAGAVIGLAPNGLRTLEKLGVIVSPEIGWRNPSGIPMTYRHWKTHEVLFQDKYHNVTNPRHKFARIHRADLQKALLNKLPPSIIHLKKRVIGVDASNKEEVTVYFEDSTSIKADLVIGADGIKSKVRKAFIPNHELSWTGEAIFRTTFPYAVVEDIKDLPQDSTHWVGPKGWIFGTRIGSDQYSVTCGFPVNQYDPDAPFKGVVWNEPADVAVVQKAFKDFNPVVAEIVYRIPSIRRYANVAGAALDHWNFNDRVTLLGDAAHTHGGAFAAGTSLAIDDAFALYLSLAAAIPAPSKATTDGLAVTASVSSKQLRYALSLYEATRRPQSDKVLEIVHEGHVKTRERIHRIWSSGVDETDEEFRARLKGRVDPVWLTEHDVEAVFKKVLAASKRAQRPSDLESRRVAVVGNWHL